jgi:quercetin dioxygenase-like cupin family protein
MLLVRNERIAIALLRFGEQGTIDEHAADHDIDVVCVHGRGHVSVGAAQAPFGEGERVRWPAGEPHRLWTEDSRMTTLMVEYPGAEPHGTPTAPNAVRR